MAAITQQRPANTTTIRTPLFVLGVGLALVAFLIMFAFGFIYVGRSSAGSQVRVVVAATDIQAREPITAAMLTLNTLPASAVSEQNAFLRIQDLGGYAAIVNIYKGEPITTNLVDQGDSLGASESSFLPIPKGYVAITIPASELQEVGGYVGQGDYIDVFAYVNTGQFSNVNPHAVVKTVFLHLYVLRVGPQSVVPRQGQPQGVSSSLTVLMTLCDAQYMDWLVNNAQLKYVLESYKDYASAPAAADASCPSTEVPSLIGPSQIDAHFGFTKGS
ncbi:MAG TPA: Flp pilus assembly protein CpaB [Candidatus Dormibacteraeota bacterium]|nr:Flp pilus assembly protein CpaB [Candidatus Dormibacteraeota bacterium]